MPVQQQLLVRDKRHQGRSFRAWVGHMRGLGYAYEDRDLCCADYGVPTTRRRFFAVMRRDGLPIRWPAPTHSPRLQAKALGLRPWVPASSIIDWSIPCPSIFDRKKPLAPKSMRRIGAGMVRYVLENPEPFIIPITHAGGARVRGLSEPLPTLTTANRGELALIAPVLVQAGYGEAPGQAPRVLDLDQPLGTVVAGGGKHALAVAWMVQHNLGSVGQDMREPLSTLTTRGTQQQLGVAYLAHLRGSSIGIDPRDPLPTLTCGGGHVAAVVAFLTQYYSTGTQAQGDPRDPLGTLTTLHRFGVVTVTIAGQPWAVADIGMRMLTAEEAARAHGLTLPKLITVGGRTRPLTKTEGMRLIGNSVPPELPRLLARANAVHALEMAA